LPQAEFALSDKPPSSQTPSGLREIVNQWMRTPSLREQYSILGYVRACNPYLFAHHPPLACFRDHVWHVGGFFICKGCLMSAVGLLVGAALYAATGWLDRWPVVWVAAAFVAMLLPTVASSLLGAPRAVKHGARLVLGVLTASAAIFIIVGAPWWAAVIVVATYLAVRIPLSRKRARQNKATAAQWRSTQR
jgi:hypothetical protein